MWFWAAGSAEGPGSSLFEGFQPLPMSRLQSAVPCKPRVLAEGSPSWVRAGTGTGRGQCGGRGQCRGWGCQGGAGHSGWGGGRARRPHTRGQPATPQKGPSQAALGPYLGRRLLDLGMLVHPTTVAAAPPSSSPGRHTQPSLAKQPA